MGLGQSCQPSGEECRRLRQGARRGSCREVRDRGRSQGTLPAAIGDRFDKDCTRERTLCQARKDSPKSSYTREVDTLRKTKHGKDRRCQDCHKYFVPTSDLPHKCSVPPSRDGEPSVIRDPGRLKQVHQGPIQPFYLPEVLHCKR